MSRRMDRRQRVVAAADDVAVRKTAPRDVVLRVLIGPRQLREHRRWMLPCDRRCSGSMIAMVVRDEHGVEGGGARVERHGGGGKVGGRAGPSHGSAPTAGHVGSAPHVT